MSGTAPLSSRTAKASRSPPNGRTSDGQDRTAKPYFLTQLTQFQGQRVTPMITHPSSYKRHPEATASNIEKETPKHKYREAQKKCRYTNKERRHTGEDYPHLAFLFICTENSRKQTKTTTFHLRSVPQECKQRWETFQHTHTTHTHTQTKESGVCASVIDMGQRTTTTATAHTGTSYMDTNT